MKVIEASRMRNDNQGCNHSSIIINGMSSWKQFVHSSRFICCLQVASPILIWCIKPIEVPSASQGFVLFLIHQCLLSLKLGVPSSCLAIKIKVVVCFNWLSMSKEKGRRKNSHTHLKARGWFWNFPFRYLIFVFPSL